MDTDWIAERFKKFAVLECEGSSELYKKLSLRVAEDEELLQMCVGAGAGQPIPNLLFGAVHHLLYQGGDHQLRGYYASFGNECREEDDPFPAFKDFCLQHMTKIQKLLETKRVQTNEVRRCAYLYPVFCHIYEQTNKPLALIEIGTSAGLQLLWDHYSYSYGGDEVYGNKDSDVLLTSRVRNGEVPRELLEITPLVKDRIGVDLSISDLTKQEDYQWLKSLIWPEHSERISDFDAAVNQLRQHPPDLREGDGVAQLVKTAAEIPEDNTLCIFHTHVANQMPDQVKEDVLQSVHEIGKNRDTFHVYNNISDRKLHIDSYLSGRFRSVTIGETDGHGRWFDWSISD